VAKSAEEYLFQFESFERVFFALEHSLFFFQEGRRPQMSDSKRQRMAGAHDYYGGASDYGSGQDYGAAAAAYGGAPGYGAGAPMGYGAPMGGPMGGMGGP
jgi:hypothetical protein